MLLKKILLRRVNTMLKYFKQLLRIWRCELFHEHKIEKVYHPGGVFPPDVYFLKGCRKCDLWQHHVDLCKKNGN